MTPASVFSNLGEVQLYALKSQYLASLQMVDQMETALKTQLVDLGKARKQIEESMRDLDHALAESTSHKQKRDTQGEPAEPARAASRAATRKRAPAPKAESA